MVETYKKGFSVKRLSSEFGVSEGTAYKLLKANTSMRKPGPKLGSIRSEKRKAILTALEIGGRKSLSEIAKSVGVTREYARQVAELGGYTQYRIRRPGSRRVYRDGQYIEFPDNLESDRWA